jgi:hypothetical protein
MAYHNTNESWIAPSEYTDVITYFNSITLTAFLAEQLPCPEDEDPESYVGEPCLSEGNYAFSGALSADEGRPFDPDRTDVVKLVARFPVQQILWPSQPNYTYSNVTVEDLPFRMVFRSEGADISVPFDARVYTHPEQKEEEIVDTTYLGYFQVLVPPHVVEASNTIDIEFRGQTLPFMNIDEIGAGEIEFIVAEPLEVLD